MGATDWTTQTVTTPTYTMTGLQPSTDYQTGLDHYVITVKRVTILPLFHLLLLHLHVWFQPTWLSPVSAQPELQLPGQPAVLKLPGNLSIDL